MRFNPPPNWPPVPKGWRPEPGWQPDPSWPDPPAGWQLWVGRDSRDTLRWVVAIGALVVVLALTAGGAYWVYLRSSFHCWNGERGTKGQCTPIVGVEGLTWIAPALHDLNGKTVAGRSCGSAPQTDRARSSAEAVECSWPTARVTVDVERYASAQAVPRGKAREQWLVGGDRYGLSQLTTDSSGGAERTLIYDGQPYVITVSGASADVVSAVSGMAFRSLHAIRDGGGR
ncbi:hypothetical protein P0W64_22070 [Tsukamurella sp. 8F]|uniref:hypothetical protein n=1 Tax=unclassified Tsukamurella TaxID=2633480 RepID=UPI0023BA318F|nr:MULTISPECIES: hypothetical protein [unclassified Tsukamurella]MDF0528936.1 hypothetical protein [Tsukamurella sp. 8J]MDF0589475.1 hypothetical protein [Tsukamurella sp. 8F]